MEPRVAGRRGLHHPVVSHNRRDAIQPQSLTCQQCAIRHTECDRRLAGALSMDFHTGKRFLFRLYPQLAGRPGDRSHLHARPPAIFEGPVYPQVLMRCGPWAPNPGQEEEHPVEKHRVASAWERRRAPRFGSIAPPRIGHLHLVLYNVRQHRLDDLARVVGLLGHPISKARPETVRHGRDPVIARASWSTRCTWLQRSCLASHRR